MNLIAELHALLRALNEAHVDYAVCGGIALAIHGHPRFTKDIDLLVQLADRDRIRELARTCGFTLESGPLLFGARTHSEREISSLSKTEGAEFLTLDLLFAGPAFASAWATRERVEWQGPTLWIVSRKALIEMKRISSRAQDLADIEALEQDPRRRSDG